MDTIAVTTRDPLDDILAAGNSAAWSIDVRQWADRLTYLLCVRKIDGGRHAFLLCKKLHFIEDVEATRRSKSKRKKYAILFGEYALLDTSARWKKSQNPVQFGQLNAFISEEAIPAPSAFQKTRPRKTDAPRFSYSSRGDNPDDVIGISVAEAKRALAARFGVPEESITITIQA